MTRDIRDAVTAGQPGAVTIGLQLRPPFDCHANARLPVSVRDRPPDTPEHGLPSDVTCSDIVL